MVEAIFHPRRRRIGASRVAIGFTLTRAEPSARSLGDRELAVLRAIATGCRALGYAPPVHVADEPALYGLPTSLSKEEGGTLTTWVCGVLEMLLTSIYAASAARRGYTHLSR
jgi:hypothetical protein